MNDIEKNKNLKIIITVSVIIILLLAVIIGVIYTVKKLNSGNKEENIIAFEEPTKNEIAQAEEAQKVVNNTIVEDETESLNRRFGRIEIVWVDKENNIIAKPLAPVLNGMTPVKYSDKDGEFVETTNNDGAWYNYENQKWANAVDKGSYFVWIPRFAYKIVYYQDSTYSKEIGYCDYRGLLKKGENNSLIRIEDNAQGYVEVGNHYILEPAFQRDTATGYKNGGWDGNLSGIWISKYEMSMETNGSHTETTDRQIGDVLLSDSIKAVSKPGVSSWRNITIATSYKNAYNYNRNLESHLTKNSEWAACTYLAYSKYGRNSTPVTINKNINYLTGGHNLLSEIYSYNGNQTSNGNVTGVYDLVGGAWEFTAAFVNNDYEGLKTYGGTNEGELYENVRNTKYKTVYSSSDIDTMQYGYQSSISVQNYLLTRKRRGEAIYETSNSGYGTDSWNTTSSFFAQTDTPFFVRGGGYSSGTGAGLFSFNGSNGQSDAGVGFRVVLVCE